MPVRFAYHRRGYRCTVAQRGTVLVRNGTWQGRSALQRAAWHLVVKAPDIGVERTQLFGAIFLYSPCIVLIYFSKTSTVFLIESYT